MPAWEVELGCAAVDMRRLLGLLGSGVLSCCALGACGEDSKPRRGDEPSAQAGSPGAAEGGAGGEPGGIVMADPPEPHEVPMPCNAWPELCDRPYDSVTYLGTHQSLAFHSPTWDSPTQTVSIRAQLDAGVRVLSFEVQQGEAELVACEGDCARGGAPLSPALAEVRAFLDDNPRDVVTLLFDVAGASDLLPAALNAAQLSEVAYAHPSDEPWPTLEQLIDAETRLVLFWRPVPPLLELDATDLPLHALNDLSQETASQYASAAELDCERARGTASAPFWLVHHYLNPVDEAGLPPSAEARRQNAEELNQNPLMVERLRSCEIQHAKAPNFVLVDFFDAGDVFTPVQVLTRLRTYP